MIVVRWWIALLAALMACTTVPALPVGADDCATACEHRAALGCLEERLRGTCAPVCERASKAGLYNPACAARATTRDEMAACGVRCLP